MATYFGKVCSQHPELAGERVVGRRACLGCHRLNTAKWRKNNPGKAKAYSDAYLPKWREENKEKLREDTRVRMAAWRAENADKVKEKANSPEMRAYRSARRAKEKKATPGWANSFIITEMYDLASERAKATGVAWHVDHIVPLQSKRVCGLHCEANLRVIPADENAKKGNRHWPDM